MAKVVVTNVDDGALVAPFEHDVAHPFDGHHDAHDHDRDDHGHAAASSDETHVPSVLLPSSLDDVEARADHARDQLGHTLAELQGRLRPAGLVRSAARTLNTPGGLMLAAMLAALGYAMAHEARRRRAVRPQCSRGAHR